MPKFAIGERVDSRVTLATGVVTSDEQIDARGVLRVNVRWDPPYRRDGGLIPVDNLLPSKGVEHNPNIPACDDLCTGHTAKGYPCRCHCHVDTKGA